MGKESKLDKLLSDEEEIDLVLSYSKLSEFDRHGSGCLLEKVYVQNQGIKMGSLIDDLLFSKDTFDSRYYISQYNEPSSMLGTLCKIIIDNYIELPDQDEVIKIIERNSLWSNIKNKDLILNKLTNEFWNYLNDVYNSKNKVVVTKDEKEKAEEIVRILLEHDYSKSIFDSNMDHIYQYKFKTTIGKFKFRGILDIISVDHKNKKIYFKDLKTGGNYSSDFLNSFIKYRYYLQEAVYKLAFKDICEDLGLEGYELQPFEFIYISLKEQIPINFIVTNKWSKAALEGFHYDGYYHKGLYQLLDEIYFHWKNKVYGLSKEIYENNGTINLKDDLIRLE